MLLTLLRHGDVEGRAQVLRGRSDPVLSAYGQQQLQLAIASIEPAITAVVTSPLQRCHAFAQQYAQQHNLPLQRSEELREIDFGDWEELTLAEAEAHDPAYFTQFKQDTANWCAPHGEAYAAFRERVRTALTIIASMKTRHILAITHGGVMRALIAELLQLSPASAARIGVPLAGICQLWLDEQVPDEPIQGSLLRLHWLDAPCAT
ncbi:MAG: histidine phosphatase family protein [Steroidobacteraceae bacterium]